MATDLSFTYLTSTVVPLIKTDQAAIQTAIEDMDGDASVTKMLELQMVMQQTNMRLEISSTLVKQMGDAMKGCIQKA
ncbi:MAG: EscF/YscF/HrpA family type III secretion system needle major subunit [Ramlibacter sp.]